MFTRCSFFILAVFCFLFAAEAKADCNRPATIVSRASGNFSNPNTWVGYRVPTSCDNVVIKHAVVLNQDFTLGGTTYSGQSSGSLLIEANGVLIGGKSISFSGSRSLTNQGTLDIYALNYWSGSPTFNNTGVATIVSTLAVYNGGTIQNAGTLNLNGGMQISGVNFVNQESGIIKASGNVTLNQYNNSGSVLENRGQFNITGSLTTYYGQITNNGSLEVGASVTVNPGNGENLITNGGSFKIGTSLILQATNNGNNALVSSGPMKVGGDLTSYSNFYVENIDSLVIGGNFTNGGSFVNNALDGIGQVVVNGKFTNNYSSHFTNNFGIVAVKGDFYNYALIDGDMGGFTMNQYSENAWGAVITGNIDICDSSLAAGKKFVDTNNGRIDGGKEDPSLEDGTVTQCGYDLATVQLPVTIVNWEGKYENKQVSLKWQTASEQNSATFAVERSLDGKTFQTIGQLKAAGNSTTRLSYSLVDKQLPWATTWYYRLKETDLDGTLTYSTIIAITNSAVTQQMRVYPNPVATNQVLQVAVQGAAMGTYCLEVMDVYGKLHYNQVVEVKESNPVFAVPASVTANLKNMALVRISGVNNNLILNAKILVK